MTNNILDAYIRNAMTILTGTDLVYVGDVGSPSKDGAISYADFLAQIIDDTVSSGWIPISDTWTYASATTITVPSGAASIYSVGDKFTLVANSVKLYGYIITVANTLLTVAGDALTNHAFSSVKYSKATSPLNFPADFEWTPASYTGFSVDPNIRWTYSFQGRQGLLIGEALTNGTSNASGFSATGLPFTILRRTKAAGTGAVSVTLFAEITAGSTTINFYTDGGGGFPTSGNKVANVTIPLRI